MLSKERLKPQTGVEQGCEIETITIPLSEYQALKASISELEARVVRLMEEIKTLRHQHFDKKSETLQKPSGDEAKVDTDGLKTELVSNYTRKKRNDARTRLIDTSSLPRYIIEHDLSDSNCHHCHEPMSCMGVVRSEKIELLPQLLYVVEHQQKKYTCSTCQDIKLSPKPLSVIPKGLAGASFIKELIINKYEYHLPLYRQSKQWASQKISISDSVLSRWVQQVGEGLLILYTALWQALEQSHYLQVDESPVKVLKPERKGYFWCYLSPLQKLVFYELSLMRSGLVAEKRLKRFKGLLQTDGYSGYTVIKARCDMTGFSCMTHSRRYFHNVVKISNNKDGIAAYVLSQFSKLYAIEAFARENQLDFRTRKRLRQKQAFLILKHLFKYLKQKAKIVPPKSKLGDAIRYTLKREKELKRYLRYGEVEIDTNLVENKMRPVALGRRNWLRVGHEGSGHISALFYSLIQSCLLNGINPKIYIHYLLTQRHVLRRQPNLAHDLLPNRISSDILEVFEKEQFGLIRQVIKKT